MTLGICLGLLLVSLGVAVVRPRGLPEAAGAVPAAALAVGAGLISRADAVSEAREIGPTLGFLAAVLVLGHLCEQSGLFAAVGRYAAVAARGQPVRLLAIVFAATAVVTAVLSLDTTVVLLTPVVLATASRVRVRAEPHLYACVHLANSSSLLLPVSNLTNLIAYRRSGLGFGGFAAVMALPWALSLGIEWLAHRRVFRVELGAVELEAGTAAVPHAAALEDAASHRSLDPIIAAVVVAATLAGFVLSSALGVDPALAAAAGAVVLGLTLMLRGNATPAAIGRAVDLPFLAFVLGLAVVVRAASGAGLGSAVDHLVPSGDSLVALLAVAALAALLANLVNNLPAILLLLPVVAGHGTGPVLAALIGVDVGPNLTYTGSLATLLWRTTLRGRGAEPAPPHRRFLRLGLATVPATLLLSTLALWAVLRLR